MIQRQTGGRTAANLGAQVRPDGLIHHAPAAGLPRRRDRAVASASTTPMHTQKVSSTRHYRSRRTEAGYDTLTLNEAAAWRQWARDDVRPA